MPQRGSIILITNLTFYKRKFYKLLFLQSYRVGLLALYPRKICSQDITIDNIYLKVLYEVAIGSVTGSVSCGYRSGSLIYDTLRMSTRRFVDLEI